jgi:hypothetical protein
MSNPSIPITSQRVCVLLGGPQPPVQHNVAQRIAALLRPRRDA